MIPEITSAFRAISPRHSVSGSLGHVLSGLLIPIFGPARNIETTQKRDVLLQSKRDVLAAEIERARKSHRPVKHLHKEAYSLTNEILRRGVK